MHASAGRAGLHLSACRRAAADTRADACVCVYMRRAVGIEWLASGRWSLGALQTLDLSATQVGNAPNGPLLLAQGLKRFWGLRRLLLAENRLMDQVLAAARGRCGWVVAP